jgi:hypothetical protein
MRERLRAELPGFMPGAWPRKLRSLVSDLGLVVSVQSVLPRQFFATPVDGDGLAALVEGTMTVPGVARGPVLVAAADPHNPVRGWPAAEKWAEPGAFFARFKMENMQLRPSVVVTTEGGSGVREPGPQRKPPRKTQFNDMGSAFAAAVPEAGFKAQTATGDGVGDTARLPGGDKLVGVFDARRRGPCHLFNSDSRTACAYVMFKYN